MPMYLIFKNNVHVATAYSPEDADKMYLDHDADDIQEVENENIIRYDNEY